MDTPPISTVPAYQDSFIAWFDVLGFAKMMKSEDIIKLRNILNDLENDAGLFKEIFNGVLVTRSRIECFRIRSFSIGKDLVSGTGHLSEVVSGSARSVS